MRNSNRGADGCLVSLLRLITGGKQDDLADATELPYRLRDDFLSPAELSFYHVLRSVIGDRAIVFAKVRLADLFFTGRPNENVGFINRIAQRHVDFVVCEPRTLKPLVGVELDDSSHEREDRIKRDAFVDRVFQAAKLPLVRVRCKTGYSAVEIEEMVGPHLAGAAERSSGPSAAASLIAGDNASQSIEQNPTIGPKCPKCGIPMLLREARRGEKRGEQFYGCSNYPRCREISPVRR